MASLLLRISILVALGLYLATFVVNNLEPSILPSVEDRILPLAFLFTGVSCALLLFSLFRKRRPPLRVYWYVATICLVYLMMSSPGFLESRWRAKYARVRTEMRNVHVEIGRYWEEEGRLPSELTDVALKEDRDRTDFVDAYSTTGGPFHWVIVNAAKGMLISVGPDQELSRTADGTRIEYDPSNGVSSKGDIIRVID